MDWLAASRRRTTSAAPPPAAAEPIASRLLRNRKIKDTTGKMTNKSMHAASFDFDVFSISDWMYERNTASVDGLESVVGGRTETARVEREMLADDASRLLWDIACPFPARPLGMLLPDMSCADAAVRLRLADAGVIVLDVAVDTAESEDEDDREGVS